MFTLIKNIDVYAPESIGINDILICGEKIVEIGKDLNYNLKNVYVIDGTGKSAVPGIIDQHVHVLGGGGEGGYRTRVPEVKISDLINAGITTVVGLLGTDCVTRNMDSLVAKTKALKEYGLNAYCLTGGYEHPSPTVTGSLKKDIVMIEEIIGVKLALSDHRSSAVTIEELSRIALEARVGGMLSGKAGYLKLHLGDAPAALDFVIEIVKKNEVPIKVFRPTHVGRKKELFYQAVEFNKMGGYIDITAMSVDPLSLTEMVNYIKKNGGDLSKVTFTSDGNGSWSTYDSDGKLLEIGAASCSGGFKGFLSLVKEGMSISEAITFVSCNVANALSIEKTIGYLKENYSADILVLDKSLEIDAVISRGNLMMENKTMTFKGFFE